MKKILFIYPPMDESYYTDGINDFLPLGLLYLYNHICKNLKLPVDIDIIDGEYHNMEEILKMIKNYDMISLQPMMASYENTLSLLIEAKKHDIVTVLGGHHATQLKKEILINRYNTVDYIIQGDGERALAELIMGKNRDEIPNLVYYDKQKECIKENSIENFPINENIVSTIDLKLLEQYYKDPIRDSQLERSEKLTNFRAYSHKGCQNRENSQYCVFCGRADRGVRFKDPKLYIKELEYFSTFKNIKYIFEIGDDFLQDESWLSEVAKLFKKNLINSGVKLKIFARANRITPSVIKYLKIMNVDEVAIGFESGSKDILKHINKNATPEDNINAAKLLFKNGIDTIASFVLGLPGETIETLEETYKQALYIQELSFKYLQKKPQEVIANIIEINPGSPAFKSLVKAFPNKYKNVDLLDIKETQEDYFKLNFGLKSNEELKEFRKMLINYGKKINDLGMYTYPAGWLKEDFQNGK